MKTTLKTLALTTVALVAMALIPSGVLGGGKRHAYRIVLSSNSAGGPVRTVQTGKVNLPTELKVQSTPELDDQEQAMLAWHFRNAAHLAEAFAKKEGVALQRNELPANLEMFLNPSGVAAATNMPQHTAAGQAVARIDLRNGTVYLGRKTPVDLYTELGKWFYYEPNYQWGKKRLEDMKRLRLAERFARYCLNSGNWVEKGGSAKSLW